MRQMLKRYMGWPLTLWGQGGLVLVFLLSALSPVAAVTPTDTARYEVTFESTWSANTHPQNFPSNPHFSPLIGGTHNAQVVFWEPGGLATPGIQDVAELGSRSQLRNEVTDAIANGTAGEVISGDGIGLSPGSVTTSFSVQQSHPLVTLVTMLAPSPDWFIGVHGLSLFEGGRWLSEVVVEVFIYDAGTDSGVLYGSPNEATVPPQPITRLNGPPFLVNGVVPPLGTLTFRRTDLQCDIEMRQVRYRNGETIQAEEWRLENLSDASTTLEVGIWLDIPGLEPLSIVNDVREAPPGADANLGPLSMLTLGPDDPRGTYTVGCRLLDPVTKLLRYETMVPIEVE